METNNEICHAEYWANLAEEFLKELWLEKDKIDKIKHCIYTHRYRKNRQAESLEAKILFDADKLDSIWATWIGRAFMYANEVGAKLHNEESRNIEETQEHSNDDTAYSEYVVKLSKIKDKLFTETAKNIAKKRHETMEKFFEELNSEIWFCDKEHDL